MGDTFGSKATRKVSEFFLHLMAYGGLSFKDGLMYMWGDPYIFMPLTAFYRFQNQIINKLKTDGKEALYWSGKMSGRNATVALISKYGLDISDLPSFVNGATQDGFGYFEIKDTSLNSKPMFGHLISKNCAISDAFILSKSKSKEPVDRYICGLLAGGCEPLFKVNVLGKEKTCRGRGDKECLFELMSSDKQEYFKIFQKAKLDQKKIEQQALKLYLMRKRSSSFFNRKEFNVNFGNGEFNLNNIRGVVIASYVIVILDYLLKRTVNQKDYYKIINEFSKNCITGISNQIIVPSKTVIGSINLDKSLNSLSIFGLGKFNIKYTHKETYVIENKNNSYPRDYLFLFGRSNEGVDFFSGSLLKNFFELYTNKSVEVKEISCVAKGQGSCLFEVKIIS